MTAPDQFLQPYRGIKVEDLRWTLRATCSAPGCDFAQGPRKPGSHPFGHERVVGHVRKTGHTVTTRLDAIERFSPAGGDR